MPLPFFKKKDPIEQHYHQVVKHTAQPMKKRQYGWPDFVKAFAFDRTPSDKKGQLFKMIMSSRKNFL